MILELNLVLNDTAENVMKIKSAGRDITVKIEDLEYEVSIDFMSHKTERYQDTFSFADTPNYYLRSSTVILNGIGDNKRDRQIMEATALVNKKKAEYKEAQRKLSELNGPKAQ